MKKKIILIDGSSYLYRAYYATFSINNFSKKPYLTIFIVIRMIRKLFIKYKPDYFIIIFDSKKKNFRHKLYLKYKSNRPNMPENLSKQIKPLYSLLKYIGIPTLSINGIEADDIIGTLAIKSKKYGIEVFISTEDKDLFQLVSKNISIINSKKNIILKSKEIKKKIGVYPSFIIDYLSLVGDPSDNIPGVLGIGKKTAILLLNKIGKISCIYKLLKKKKSLNIKNNLSIEKKLIKNKKLAFLSYNLVKIKTNIPINFKIENYIIRNPKIKKLIFLCNNFKLFYLKNNIKKFLFK